MAVSSTIFLFCSCFFVFSCCSLPLPFQTLMTTGLEYGCVQHCIPYVFGFCGGFSCCSLPSLFFLTFFKDFDDSRTGIWLCLALYLVFVCLFSLPSLLFFQTLMTPELEYGCVQHCMPCGVFNVVFLSTPVQDYAAEAGRSLQDGGCLPAGI